MGRCILIPLVDALLELIDAGMHLHDGILHIHDLVLQFESQLAIVVIHRPPFVGQRL